MDEKTTTGATTSSPTWQTLGLCIRAKLQAWIQVVLDEDLTELPGREKSERRAAVDALPSCRHGHGAPHRVSTPWAGDVGALIAFRARASWDRSRASR